MRREKVDAFYEKAMADLEIAHRHTNALWVVDEWRVYLAYHKNVGYQCEIANHNRNYRELITVPQLERITELVKGITRWIANEAEDLPPGALT